MQGMISMRAVLYGFWFSASLAAAAMGGAVPAVAASGCSSQAEQAAFDTVALQSELQVIAKACHTEDAYNSFVTRYRPALAAAHEDVSAWFKKAAGKSAQKVHDIFITGLANGQSTSSLKEGSDFCVLGTPLFTEVMALPKDSMLASYAAGKDTYPATAPACRVLQDGPAVSTPSSSRRSRKH
ncbi:Hypothetical protein GbCGDNIH6_1904 [Granulibacter bethesdensis]|nr:Hypothetical protein GbCGDNIH6_1904 [Granulibacter bethesdensis]